MTPPWEMRRRFNEGRYWERALEGEFICRADQPPKKHDPESRDEPPGTASYIVEYFRPIGNDQFVFVFRVHVYVRSDGTIGGRDAVLGRNPRPDPKTLVEDGVKYCHLPSVTTERTHAG